MSMDCVEAEELLAWVVVGTAADAERAGLYRHVAECAACRRDLAQALALQRRLNAAMGSLPAADADAGRQLAASLTPAPAPRKADAVTLTTSAMRALGAPPAVTQSLDLLQRLANWRPSTNLIAPFIPTVAQAASTP